MSIEELRGLLIKDGEKATERVVEILNKMSEDAANGKTSIADFIDVIDDKCENV